MAVTARTSSGASSEMSSSFAGGMFGGSILTEGGWCGSSADGCSSKAAMVAGPLLPPGLLMDAEGYLTATYVHYEQLAQPKGECGGAASGRKTGGMHAEPWTTTMCVQRVRPETTLCHKSRPSRTVTDLT